ncbi:MAG: Flp pilus assembly complex ATPase component TadA [Erysipelotrichaceae bacterium]|nr:Flp pilus assembly complex ATPase component TadA [Erysipelotrichaceae bacterium]
MEERLLAILRLALKYNATDIHFNMKFTDVEIFMRIDGIPKKVKAKIGDDKLIRYLQYLANLDIGNLTKPQTGQFEMEVDDTILSLRFAVVNTYNLTSAVLRILNSSLRIDADSLSGKKNQNEFFKELLRKENGLILFAGPTGSGKTTTLYTLLKSVKDEVIYTIEDPIEVYNDDFVQLQINEKIGFDYENGIKQIMRHDPDIIMIGEIRDDKAARMAVRAANTGHLVVSTIHASSAASAISRMTDLGVNESHLYEMLLCIVYQRMIIDRKSEKRVIYEVMDRKEIEYFRTHKKNSSSFISVDDQIEKGLKDGIY